MFNKIKILISSCLLAQGVFIVGPLQATNSEELTDDALAVVLNRVIQQGEGRDFLKDKGKIALVSKRFLRIADKLSELAKVKVLVELKKNQVPNWQEKAKEVQAMINVDKLLNTIHDAYDAKTLLEYYEIISVSSSVDESQRKIFEKLISLNMVPGNLIPRVVSAYYRDKHYDTAGKYLEIFEKKYSDWNIPFGQENFLTLVYFRKQAADMYAQGLGVKKDPAHAIAILKTANNGKFDVEKYVHSLTDPKIKAELLVVLEKQRAQSAAMPE